MKQYIKADMNFVFIASEFENIYDKTAVCTLTCQHNKLEIYEALGLVEVSVEPHLDKDNISEELLEVSEQYPLYGI